MSQINCSIFHVAIVDREVKANTRRQFQSFEQTAMTSGQLDGGKSGEIVLYLT